jgi:hypothetical protein
MTVILIAGVLLSLTKRRRKTGHRLLFLACGLYLVFTSSPLAELAIANLERLYPPLQTVDSSGRVERIVILSGWWISLLSVTSLHFAKKFRLTAEN